jgi:hypothetical protein
MYSHDYDSVICSHILSFINTRILHITHMLHSYAHNIRECNVRINLKAKPLQ